MNKRKQQRRRRIGLAVKDNALLRRVCKLMFCLLLIAPISSYADCFESAALPYASIGMTPQLLRDIAMVESSMKPQAVNRTHLSHTNSVDIGYMQINSRNLSGLKKRGIDVDRIYEPCENIRAGAMILADVMQRHGNSWEAVGAYNTACTELKGLDCQRSRQKYAWKVYRAGLGYRGPVQRTGPPAVRNIVRVMVSAAINTNSDNNSGVYRAQ